MKAIIKKSLQGLLLVPMLALGVSAVVPVVQSDVAYAQLNDGINAANPGNVGTTATKESIIKTVTDLLLFIVGAVSVIMLIYGGFKYITSGGDSSGVTAAKNTILYSVIGLVVAVLAYAIVQFVLTELGVISE